MLAPTEPRCAGFAPGTQHDTCPRRGACARFRSRAVCPDTGPLYPFEWSACEGGDAFLHVANVGQDATEGNPYPASRAGVLAVNTVNTTSESA